jgi:hypothetical protein
MAAVTKRQLNGRTYDDLIRARITRNEFEKRLKWHLDQKRIGTYRRARQEIGEAWKLVIDGMYRKRARDLTYANLSEVSSECADAILRVLKAVKSGRR